MIAFDKNAVRVTEEDGTILGVVCDVECAERFIDMRHGVSWETDPLCYEAVTTFGGVCAQCGNGLLP